MAKDKPVKSKLKGIYNQIVDAEVWAEFSEGGDFVKENYLSLTFLINEKDCIIIELSEIPDGTQEYNLYKGEYRSPEPIDGTIKRI